MYFDDAVPPPGATSRMSPPPAANPWETLQAVRCNIFVHDLPLAQQISIASSVRPKGRRFPRHDVGQTADWDNSPLSTELWILRALHMHPWRVSRAEAADAIFVVTNRTRTCQAGNEQQRALSSCSWPCRLPPAYYSYTWQYSARLWTAAMEGIGNHHQLKAVALQSSSSCGPPAPESDESSKVWNRTKASEVMRETLVLLEFMVAKQMGKQAEFLRSPTPFVTAPRPTWMLEPDGVVPSPTKPWHARKLLFFVTHVPKLDISTLRYNVWRQIRRDKRVTAASRTINCTLGSLVTACRLSLKALQVMPRRFFYRFCWDACGNKSICQRREALSQTQEVERFKARCWHNRHVWQAADWQEQLDDIRTAALQAPKTRGDYLLSAAGHRFCIAVTGDGSSTPKITEYILLGGAGGCIPVFVVLRDGSPGHLARMLPYAHWLDYCRISFLVTATDAKSRMQAVLAALANVSSAEAAEKLAQLRLVRHAFAFRPPRAALTNESSASAADFVLGEVCRRAKNLGRLSRGTVASASSTARPGGLVIAGGDHRRCMLPRRDGS